MGRIASYTGQVKKLRKIAIDLVGSDEVSLMSDSEIAELVNENYAIFWGDQSNGFNDHLPTDEIVVLIPIKIFNDLRDKSEIIFVER